MGRLCVWEYRELVQLFMTASHGRNSASLMKGMSAICATANAVDIIVAL
jgi:hypothetical protein